MADNNEDITENIEEKKEKDQNNKITGWDVLDTPQLLRKVPIGPKLEDLQKSKVDQILFNKERPTSHTLKDILAFTLGNALQEGAGAAVGGAIGKTKTAKAISKYIDNILDTAADSAKTSKAVQKAARKGDDVAKGFIKDIDDAYDKAGDARYALDNVDANKAKLKNKFSDVQRSIDYDTKNLEKNNKKLKELMDVNPDDIKALDLDHRTVDSLSSEEANLYRKGSQKFDLESKNTTLKRDIRENETKAEKLLYEIEHFPTNEQLEKNVKDSIADIKKHKNILKDYLDGLSEDEITKKYGKEHVEYVESPWNKNVKTAGEKYYTLNKNDDTFLNWVAAFSDDKRSMDFLKQFLESDDTVLLEQFLMANEDLFNSIKPGAPKEVIKENGKKIVDMWDEVSKAKNRSMDSRLKIASEVDNSKLQEDLNRKAKNELGNLGDRYILGNDIFGLKMKDSYSRETILNNLKKNKRYLDNFSNILSTDDPIYKSAQRAKKTGPYKVLVDEKLKKGMSLSDAIQDIALERVIGYYDAEYDNYIKTILEHDLPPSSLEAAGIAKKPDFSKSKLRNPDGTLKSVDEVADFLTKDKVYIDSIDEIVRGLTDNGRSFVVGGALKGASAPLLARYAERAIKTGVKNSYDPFGKDPGVELPPNMKPWDASTEMSTGEKLWDNTKNFFGMNFDMDPSRYSRKQLDDMRQAVLNANEKVGKWNPEQIKGWSDREVLRLIIEAGKGTRSDIDNEIKKEYLKLIEE